MGGTGKIFGDLVIPVVSLSYICTFVLVYKGKCGMCLKNILRIGFLFIFILFEFSALWARDRDNVLVINSYTDVTVWSNYVIDSLRKDPSIKEDILVESLNMLLVEEDSIARQRKRFHYPVVSWCSGLPRGVCLKMLFAGCGKMFR